MDKKTRDYLAKVGTWIEKSPEGSNDSASVAEALADAQRAIDDVEKLKAQLDDKKKKRSLAIHVLEETFKSAKHARRAQEVREKASAPPKAPKAPKVKAAPEVKTAPVPKAGKKKR